MTCRICVGGAGNPTRGKKRRLAAEGALSQSHMWEISRLDPAPAPGYVQAYPPPGHTPFSWDAVGSVPSGHTPFSWGAGCAHGILERASTGSPLVVRQSIHRRPVRQQVTAAPAVPRWPYEISSTAIRYCALCAYEGSVFDGWMGSPQAVAAALERRLHGLFAHPVQVVGAGRTDAGVHARAMAFHFDVPSGADGRGSAGTVGEVHARLRSALLLGGGLPRELQVYVVCRAPSQFHAREACGGKRYVYRLAVGGVAPWQLPYCWRLQVLYSGATTERRAIDKGCA